MRNGHTESDQKVQYGQQRDLVAKWLARVKEAGETIHVIVVAAFLAHQRVLLARLNGLGDRVGRCDSLQ